MLGVGISLLAAVVWGLSAIPVRLGLQHMNAIRGTLISLIAGAAITWGLAAAFNWADLRHITLTAVFWFAAVGLANFPLGRLFNYMGIREIGASHATAVTSASPLFAALFAFIILSEGLNPLVAVGMLLILVGVYVSMREGLRS